MADQSENNLYPGINPHLNSALQQRGGGWRSFHTAHLMHLFEALDTLLPEAYYASPETSLQIGTYSAETIADVLILHSTQSRGASQDLPHGASPTLTLPIPQLAIEEEELSSIVIFDSEQGQPVTRIELLSPANLPQGSHYGSYLVKREQTLRSGLRLVEIDYLHESRPIIDTIPSYADAAEDSYPYHIIVTDPRPSMNDGKTDVYSVGVLQMLPTIEIPLEGQETVSVDFNALYNQTYSKRPFYRRVDYTVVPVKFTSYHRDDQQQILNA